MAGPDEELGGEPACWANLFADDLFPTATGQDAGEGAAVDLAAVAREASGPGVAWSRQSDDLNVNLLVFPSGDGVEPHVNGEVDVLIVVIAGEGSIAVDGVHRPLRAGQALLVPKGAQRAIRGVSERFAYLSCHRRRGGLWPTVRP
jgi:mannose-6-phosphate isomerase-like protein (cupin superfamily)